MFNTKRIVSILAISALAAGLAGCSSGGGETKSADGLEIVKVGASPVPHAKILKHLEESGAAKKAGIKIEVTEFTDYVQPNEALNSKDLDANYYQTVPYVESESKKRGYDFEAGKGIHLEPLAIYSEKIKNLSELKDGATIAVINDPTNQGRALKLLSDNGLIKVKDADQTVISVKNGEGTNPRDFKFVEAEGQTLVRALGDADIAVINGNYAQAGGLKTSEALAIESPEGNPAVNVLVWRKGDKKDGVAKLEELLHSQETKDFIEKTWTDKSVIPAF